MFTVTIYTPQGKKEYKGKKEEIVRIRESGILRGWGTSGIKEVSTR